VHTHTHTHTHTPQVLFPSRDLYWEAKDRAQLDALVALVAPAATSPAALAQLLPSSLLVTLAAFRKLVLCTLLACLLGISQACSVRISYFSYLYVDTGICMYIYIYALNVDTAMYVYACMHVCMYVCIQDLQAYSYG
jgi:hypothetical protein